MADNLPNAPVTPLPSMFDSSIVKALLTALATLIATIGTVFFNIDSVKFMDKANLLIGALVAFIVVALPVGYALWARVNKATPPISTAAVVATIAREEKIEAAPASLKQEASK